MRSTVAERLQAKTRRTDGCWEWTGCRNALGYGSLRVGRKTMLAHRAVWELARGPIPDGKCICHACDNPGCVRLSHLWLGTKADNSADAVAKGRIYNTRKTQCIHGHAFTEQNTYRDRAGKRQCLTCKAERGAAYFAAKPAPTVVRLGMSQKMKAIWAARRAAAAERGS